MCDPPPQLPNTESPARGGVNGRPVHLLPYDDRGDPLAAMQQARQDASIAAALATARVPDDFRLSIVDSPGAGPYPISGVLWLLVYEDPRDPAKAKTLAAFLRWTVTDGQKTARRLNFAPLPASLTGRVLQDVARIAPPA